jgi:hypothetical protein
MDTEPFTLVEENTSSGPHQLFDDVADLITKTQVRRRSHIPIPYSKDQMLTITQRTNRDSILKLPLTEDLWLKHSIDLSTSYYRNVMVTSR